MSENLFEETALEVNSSRLLYRNSSPCSKGALDLQGVQHWCKGGSKEANIGYAMKKITSVKFRVEHVHTAAKQPGCSMDSSGLDALQGFLIHQVTPSPVCDLRILWTLKVHQTDH